MRVAELTRDVYERTLREITPSAPIGQLPVWQDYESTIEGRTPWGFAAVYGDDDALLAAISFMQYETHGYRYLRARHAPVWKEVPTAEQEAAVLEALAAYVRAKDKRQVFVRLAVKHDLPSVRPCLSMLPYDTTVIINLEGGDEAILERMKPRGRRDVRKALRECELAFADETVRAIEDFAPYYEVMLQTAERDGFTAAPAEDYRNMLEILGPEHCRLFCGRDGDTVITWTIATISGTRATRFYGASRACDARFLATDRLIYFEACELGRMGCTEYDQMGIGSDLAPEMLNLNTFKTKFAKDGVTSVAPDRDLPVNKAFYTALTQVKKVRNRLRGAQA